MRQVAKASDLIRPVRIGQHIRDVVPEHLAEHQLTNLARVRRGLRHTDVSLAMRFPGDQQFCWFRNAFDRVDNEHAAIDVFRVASPAAFDQIRSAVRSSRIARTVRASRACGPERGRGGRLVVCGAPPTATFLVGAGRQPVFGVV